MADLYLGVDPGLQGALALYYPSASEKSAVPLAMIEDMPLKDGKLDPFMLDHILARWAKLSERHTVSAAIERVGSRPRQAGAFNFGLSTGIVHGSLAANGFSFELVSPTEWKPAMGLTRGKLETQEENKSRARALATQLFPNIANQFKRVRDDGRAEALLIAVYYANRRKRV